MNKVLIAILIVLAGGSALVFVLEEVSRGLRRRAFRTAVGLTFEEVCGLLPAEIRNRRFTGMELGELTDDEISVALFYECETESELPPAPGHPRNVGVFFDRRSGKLVRISPEGIPLGLM